jgi:ATP-binding cassette, subfamily C, bacterial LapB
MASDTTAPGLAVPAWSVAPSEVKADGQDPLLGCLVLLSKLHERPHSPESLTAGLPLEDGRLTLGLFHRAAQRAQLTSRIVNRPLGEIPDFTLPVILLLEERQACVLMRYVDAHTAEILVPESGGGRQIIARDVLERMYAGYAIFIRPEYDYDGRLGEEAAPPTRSWFWDTVLQFWAIYAQVLIASLLINCFALVTSLFSMNVYDRVVPNNAVETLWVLAIGVMTVLGFDFLLRTLRGRFVDTAGKSADALLSAKIFEHVLNMQIASKPTSAGAFANTLRDFDNVRDFFSTATVTALVDIPFTLLFLLVIWLIAGPIALVPLTAIPLLLIAGFALQRPLNAAIKRNQREATQRHGMLVETIGGLETLKSLNAESRLQRKWERFVTMTAQSSLSVRTLSLSIVSFSVLLQNLSYVCVIIYGVYLIRDGSLTMGALIAASILSGRALFPLSQIASLLARMDQSIVSFQDLNRIMQLPVERPVGKRFVHRAAFRGHIQFKDVTFAYPLAELPALRNVNFSIRPGEKVAFIGRLGSGKSTIAKLILNLYQPTQGGVLIDGTDLRQLDPADLRRNAGAILQDCFLFHGTIRDNIAIGAGHLDDAQILRAAKIAGVDEFVSRHPRGYDLMVGERGEGLSGGQKQAIALARALVMDPPVVVMDEPTSGMDTGSERLFMNRLGEILPDKTLILITHRASLLTLVDRIIVMDQGQVVLDAPRDKALDALNKGEIKVSAP